MAGVTVGDGGVAKPIGWADLPVFSHIPEGLQRGRSVRDGYARGWGLQFGELPARIAADPLYREAVALAGGRTVQSEANRMNIYLLLRLFLERLPAGNIVEYGSWRGGSAIFMAKVCQGVLPGVQVYALDTFAGMPTTDSRIDAHRGGDFSGVELDELRAYSKSVGLTNLHFRQGLFQDTVPGLLPSAGPLRLVHIDCDIRSAVAYAYEASLPQMVEGGYIVFDDSLFSSCLGATEVVEELVIRRDALHSEQVYPHHVFRANTRR